MSHGNGWNGTIETIFTSKTDISLDVLVSILLTVGLAWCHKDNIYILDRYQSICSCQHKINVPC